ncbi:MAG: hypothetical protein JSV03_05345 [Planctomycetota bacterium]|nr:MAG: hypothetical protein JSV03_05345 [Planctomycetota bacterium]
MDERQLHRVQENKARYRLPTTIGPYVQSVLKSSRIGDSAIPRRIIAVLEEHAGAELLDSIDMVGVRGGILSLCVIDAAALYKLRLEWEQKILLLMQSQLPGLGIIEVRFTTNMPR